MELRVGDPERLALVFAQLAPYLDERQRRLWAGAEARALGHGGIRVVARAVGMREGTVARGARELDDGGLLPGRTRARGGGRKRLVDRDPELLPALLALLEPQQRDDRVSPLLWTTKSTRALAAELTDDGHPASADTVADLLAEHGFSLQGSAASTRTTEGRQSPDRDAQFRYLNEQATLHQAAGEPVVSVETTKKERIGRFPDAARVWRPVRDPTRGESHGSGEGPGIRDDRDTEAGSGGPRRGKPCPQGVTDVPATGGWARVGADQDTASFAVTSLRRWWDGFGAASFPAATRLLVTADAGGADDDERCRAWRAELAGLAADTGLAITVCHFPPGTSRWNVIERKLCSHITHNWRGRPLVRHDVMVNAIAAPEVHPAVNGHAVAGSRARLTPRRQATQHGMAPALIRHDWHGEWNYTLDPCLYTSRPGLRRR